MSEFKAEVIEHENYSMQSGYAKNVKEMNKEAMYPAWNKAADYQAEYPNAQLQGPKVRKQVML